MLQSYVLQRLALTVSTVVGLTALVFFLLHAAVPTDTVDLLTAFQDARDPELAERLRGEFGLSGSLPRRYLGWLGQVARGDLGESLFTGRPVMAELARRLPTSVELGAGALLITVLAGIPIGILAAARRDSLPDYVLRGGTVLAYSVPDFWAATLVLVFGSVWLNCAPPLEYEPLWSDPVANIKIMAVPVLLVALRPTARLVRLVRTQVLEVAQQDYVRTAHAKGLPGRDVYFRHVLRNAMLPVVTMLGLELPRLIAGTVSGAGLQFMRRSPWIALWPGLAITLIVFAFNVFGDALRDALDPRLRGG